MADFETRPTALGSGGGCNLSPAVPRELPDAGGDVYAMTEPSAAQQRRQ